MPEASSQQAETSNSSPSKKEQYWLAHCRNCQQSGLSLAGYARSQGLVVKTFYAWHWRLRQRSLVKPEPDAALFHRVKAKPTEAPVAIGDLGILLRFRLPNGIDCEVAGIEPNSYTRLLETLASLRL